MPYAWCPLTPGYSGRGQLVACPPSQVYIASYRKFYICTMYTIAPTPAHRFPSQPDRSILQVGRLSCPTMNASGKIRMLILYADASRMSS